MKPAAKKRKADGAAASDGSASVASASEDGPSTFKSKLPKLAMAAEPIVIAPDDKAKFNQADDRRKQDNKELIVAHSRLLKLREELKKAQQKVDSAQTAYAKARNTAQSNAGQDADDLLLEPTPWNTYYKQLKSFFDREGHSNFKRTITDADVEGMTEADAKEIRTLSWWTCRQRKFKRRGELEEHKILLLNRLNFNWDPHAGPGPEKWLRHYAFLKEYKANHGHVKVPVRYAENKLGSWLKTQVTQYRNAHEGKLPALSAERIRLLEEVGINWGEKRVTTPWEDRFHTLLDYKKRFGNMNVPWQWKENVALAQWVNSQRKKYKDLMGGKRNNLTEGQIDRLNDIGFKWNTGGKGRYADREEDDNQPVVMLEQMPLLGTVVGDGTASIMVVPAAAVLPSLPVHQGMGGLVQSDPSLPPLDTRAGIAISDATQQQQLPQQTIVTTTMQGTGQQQTGILYTDVTTQQLPQQQTMVTPLQGGGQTGILFTDVTQQQQLPQQTILTTTLQQGGQQQQQPHAGILSSGIAQDQLNVHNRMIANAASIMGNQEVLNYAQRIAQQNQQDVSMLAYAYQQLNNQPQQQFGQQQIMNTNPPSSALFDSSCNGGVNPFIG